jgi:hypothetical protein
MFKARSVGSQALSQSGTLHEWNKNAILLFIFMTQLWLLNNPNDGSRARQDVTAQCALIDLHQRSNSKCMVTG